MRDFFSCKFNIYIKLFISKVIAVFLYIYSSLILYFMLSSFAIKSYNLIYSLTFYKKKLEILKSIKFILVNTFINILKGWV